MMLMVRRTTRIGDWGCAGDGRLLLIDLSVVELTGRRLHRLLFDSLIIVVVIVWINRVLLTLL